MCQTRIALVLRINIVSVAACIATVYSTRCKALSYDQAIHKCSVDANCTLMPFTATTVGKLRIHAVLSCIQHLRLHHAVPCMIVSEVCVVDIPPVCQGQGRCIPPLVHPLNLRAPSLHMMQSDHTVTA
jgi:hypothetical protein